MSQRLILVLAASALLSACAGHRSYQVQTVESPVVATASTVATVPLAVTVGQDDYATDGLNATAWVQTAIEYQLIFRQTYRDAQGKLLQALNDPQWDALVNNERHDALTGLAPAVILDVDETVLDNSPYQARLVRSGTQYDEATWASWVREEAAHALPGALEFTRFAASHGVQVIYISNRDQSLDQATLDNLREQGFPVSGPEAFLGLGVHVSGCQQVGSDKSCRRQLVAQKYRILMQVGDQIGDFMPIPDNSLQGRRAAVQTHIDWFGERWFVLPNPTYGSWEPALFDNDWSQGPRERHAAKIKALRIQ